ncbi:MAG: tetratricopeptide repeat protein [Paracoccaceae bacterium]
MRHIMRAALLTAAIVALPQSGGANSFSGAYLAAQRAADMHDYTAAARYFQRALARQPSNPDLMEQLTLANLLQGKFDRSLDVALKMEADGLRSQVAQMVLIADLARRGQFSDIDARASAGTQGIGPLVDGLLKSWALLGDDQTEVALAEFETLSSQQGLRGFSLYHKALALGMLGRYEDAEAIFANDTDGSVQMTRRGAMARAEMLSQQGRNEDALRTLEDAFGAGTDPGISALRAALSGPDPVPFTHVTSPTDGLAEVFYSIAAALTTEAQPDYTLLYARVALALRPDHTDALLLAAELLDDLEQYELALDTFAQMPLGHVDYHAAELGRVGALRALDKPDAALEVLKTLRQTHGTLPLVHSTMGDILRSQDRYDEAVQAYDAALDLTPDDTARGKWFLYYARAISFERQGAWDKAEADFRAALKLDPNQPQVLNYLGYSLVEKQIKLDEALDMIERAVAARPQSGFIVDSLGWVLYRLGRYEEAVGHMERAVELMPVDPVVNDHLGDVYWSVGRHREARFQWSRALSFVDLNTTTTEADPDRIRRKLDVGLDVVLKEEGAPPLKVADDG